MKKHTNNAASRLVFSTPDAPNSPGTPNRTNVIVRRGKLLRDVRYYDLVIRCIFAIQTQYYVVKHQNKIYRPRIYLAIFKVSTTRPPDNF